MDPAAVWAKGGSAAELPEGQADLQWSVWKLSARAYSVSSASSATATTSPAVTLQSARFWRQEGGCVRRGAPGVMRQA